MLVTSDTRNNDDVLLPALEGVHTGDLQVLVDLGVEGALVQGVNIPPQNGMTMDRSDKKNWITVT